ncbi:condensin complex subunit 2-like [Centruroides sculpturatus]|uniref:condensin complex subunit 2-like n=1 Tax=Centruroides sculpturatus TaxID=218467 RepID=UPI000C6DAFFB|nr:condensin complex subunit 2-like [Centruroides sculpturatus]
MLFNEEASTNTLQHSLAKPTVAGIIRIHKRNLSKGELQASPRYSDVPQNDDELERKQRRKEKIEQLQRDITNSPLTPAEKRKSIAINSSGLTNAQLAEHYANCMKLFTENKINVKNAFGLHLIDYMPEILNKDGETNFQIASCTLDAGTKIYASRVDCVYANTFKIASGLGIVEDNRKNNEQVENVENGEEHGKTDKKKKKLKKSSTVEQNPNSLNIKKFDSGFQVDPLFLKMSNEFDTGGLNGFLFNTFPAHDGNEQIIDSRNIPLPYVEEEEKFIDKTELKEIFNYLQRNVNIDPQLSEMSFLNSEDNIRKITYSHNDIFSPPDKRKRSLYDEATITNSEYSEEVFTEDTDEMLEDSEELTDRNVNSLPSEFDEFSRGRAFSDRFELLKDTSNKIMIQNVSDMATVLADKPSEYSYFNNNLLSGWAGPKHWKLFNQNKAKPDSSEKSNENKRKTIKVFKLDYNKENNFDDHFVKASKSIKLSEKTMENWNEEKVTLPNDLHYDIRKLIQIFLKPITIKHNRNPMEVKGINYNYDNPNDCENYCPDIQDDSDIENEKTRFPNVNFTCFEATQIGEKIDMITPSCEDNSGGLGNLIEEPQRILKIDIHYARTAKKIDIKRLKKHMWKILISHHKDTENTIDKEIVNQKMDNKIYFSRLYNILPNYLSSTMINNLSVPIAFVSLLHLVNEQNLALEGHSDLCDFIIYQQ